MLVLLIVAVVFVKTAFSNTCKPSITTVTGSAAPKGNICSGQLLLNQEFDRFNRNIWTPEVNMAGGGNNEFQIYLDDPNNIFVANGQLNIKPTLSSHKYGESFLSNGTLDLGPVCKNDYHWSYIKTACVKTGTLSNIINPIISGRIKTQDKFAFKYGTIEVRARIPTGDWLWPAIWLLPNRDTYGYWPASGEIDIMEARGNLKYKALNTWVGVQQVGATVHFGPNPKYNAFLKTNYASRKSVGYNTAFSVFKLVWDDQGLSFYVDGIKTGYANGTNGFWNLGDFDNTTEGTVPNPWINGTVMAPFDKEFYIIINLAVGGSYFGDWGTNYPKSQPWTSKSAFPQTDFWNGKSQWMMTWGSRATFKVDYVRVWAL